MMKLESGKPETPATAPAGGGCRRVHGGGGRRLRRRSGQARPRRGPLGRLGAVREAITRGLTIAIDEINAAGGVLAGA